LINKYTINSEDSLSDMIGILRHTFKEKKYFQVTVNDGKKRSIEQNFVSHGWYAKVSKEEGEYTPEQIKCLCKYHFALPILRAEDPVYNEWCCNVIDQLSYENRVEAMKYTPATSLMTTKQLSSYMEHIQRHYAGRVELEFEE